MEHTPGPWRWGHWKHIGFVHPKDGPAKYVFCPEGNDGYTGDFMLYAGAYGDERTGDDTETWVLRGTYDNIMGHCSVEPDSMETQALIAAAPDLLAAARLARQWPNDPGQWFNQLFEAIKLAETVE